MHIRNEYIKHRIGRFHENCHHFYKKHVLPLPLYRKMAKKKQGHEKYTIVSACYNVQSYIAEFIDSIIGQRLDFLNNIFLVCVDDGSTDGTAALIKKYAAQYPDNITYVRKENGGQASARNLGMRYAKTEWITFCDPDDILDYNCFFTIDNALAKYDNVSMVAMNLIFYFEKDKKLSDTHPLKYKFDKKIKFIKINDLKCHIQLSSATALFRKSIIDRYGLKQPETLKPNFEDAYFITMYLAHARFDNALFLKNAQYLYRKRENASSTLDRSWSDKRKFSDIFSHGYLPMFKHFHDHAIQNDYEKNIFLYEIQWHLKTLLDCPERISFLGGSEKKTYLDIIEECFSYIPKYVIETTNTYGLWWYYKIGMIHCFKKQEPDFYIAYVDMYDSVKKEAHIKFFCGAEEFEYFTVDGREVIPHHSKTIRHDFCGETFILERVLWLPLPEEGTLEFSTAGGNVRLTVAGVQYEHGVDVEVIRKAFTVQRPDAAEKSPYHGCWILMDRELYADDNAEHLYRYIAKAHPEAPVYFVLMKSSPDWPRLQNEGFRLLDFGSTQHEEALRACSKIISSQADGCVTDYFGYGSLKDKQFVFLQHGVIKDNLRRWLNGKIRIDLFVTTTRAEYASILDEKYQYKFCEKEVKLLGLPRYDRLLEQAAPPENQILIMPTWRSYIVGASKNGGVIREKNPAFMTTEYAAAWKSLLAHPRLKLLHEGYGCKIIFWPHPNIRPYLKFFTLPDFIDVPQEAATNIQSLFQRSSVMVTDYSSVAFDMAFLQRAVLYYQFDEKTFFSGVHSYQKGYFDYRRDGFGPVCTGEDELLDGLENILQEGGRPASRYLERMQATFPFRDGKNCERVWQAILDLDRPYPDGHVHTGILADYVARAQRAGMEHIAAERQALLESCLRKEV